jgi:hypothetical protein
MKKCLQVNAWRCWSAQAFGTCCTLATSHGQTSLTWKSSASNSQASLHFYENMPIMPRMTFWLCHVVCVHSFLPGRVWIVFRTMQSQWYIFHIFKGREGTDLYRLFCWWLLMNCPSVLRCQLLIYLHHSQLHMYVNLAGKWVSEHIVQECVDDLYGECTCCQQAILEVWCMMPPSIQGKK